MSGDLRMPGRCGERVCPVRASRFARGLTLLEVTLAVVIIAIVASIVVPVTASLSDAYASASDTRDAVEDGAYAIDRVVRMLREAPEGATQGTVGVSRADADAVEFSDGRSIGLVGTDLILTDADGAQGVLCRGVSQFTIVYLGADGVSDVSGTPEETRRFAVTLVARGVELRAAAFARVTIVQP